MKQVELICGVCGKPRMLSPDSARQVAKGTRNNVCMSCSQKKARIASQQKFAAQRKAKKASGFDSIDLECPSCGRTRSLLARTIRTYSIKGIWPKCPHCGTAPNGQRKTKAKDWDSILPIVPARLGWRCEGFYTDECQGLYDKCLDLASRRNLEGFTCSILGGRQVIKSPCPKEESDLFVAFQSSIESQWTPEQTQELCLR